MCVCVCVCVCVSVCVSLSDAQRSMIYAHVYITQTHGVHSTAPTYQHKHHPTHIDTFYVWPRHMQQAQVQGKTDTHLYMPLAVVYVHAHTTDLTHSPTHTHTHTHQQLPRRSCALRPAPEFCRGILREVLRGVCLCSSRYARSSRWAELVAAGAEERNTGGSASAP